MRVPRWRVTACSKVAGFLRESSRSEQDRAVAVIKRLEDSQDQPHVVEQGHPVHRHRPIVVAADAAQKVEIVDQRIVRVDHALGRTGRARGVLQECDRLRPDRRQIRRSRWGQIVQQDGRQAVAQRKTREGRVGCRCDLTGRDDGAGRGVGRDGVDLIQHACHARRARQIDRDRDDARIEAAEKRRHILDAGRQEKQRTLARLHGGEEPSRRPARGLGQLGEGEVAGRGAGCAWKARAGCSGLTCA